ncbi:MAG: hypothetical protein R6V50_01480, partial [Thermoplasmatota archaeon]
PENTRIVVMFSSTLFILFFGIIALLQHIQTQIPADDVGIFTDPTVSDPSLFLYITAACFIIVSILSCVSLWRYSKNRKPRL